MFFMILLFLWPNKLLTKICWMKSWRRQPNKRMLQRRKSSCLTGKLRVFGSKRWSHFRIKPPQNIQDKFERTQFVHLKHMFCKSFITQLSYCGFHKLLSRCWGPLCYHDTWDKWITIATLVSGGIEHTNCWWLFC